MDRLPFEGCEDRRHAESHAGQEWGLDIQQTTILMVIPKDNFRTHRTDFSLRAVKTDSNTKSRAGAKISPECMTYGYDIEHHRDKWLAHS